MTTTIETESDEYEIKCRQLRKALEEGPLAGKRYSLIFFSYGTPHGMGCHHIGPSDVPESEELAFLKMWSERVLRGEAASDCYEDEVVSAATPMACEMVMREMFGVDYYMRHGAMMLVGDRARWVCLDATALNDVRFVAEMVRNGLAHWMPGLQ